jgi:hypothetical protein
MSKDFTWDFYNPIKRLCSRDNNCQAGYKCHHSGARERYTIVVVRLSEDSDSHNVDHGRLNEKEACYMLARAFRER